MITLSCSLGLVHVVTLCVASVSISVLTMMMMSYRRGDIILVRTQFIACGDILVLRMMILFNSRGDLILIRTQFIACGSSSARQWYCQVAYVIIIVLDMAQFKAFCSILSYSRGDIVLDITLL